MEKRNQFDVIRNNILSRKEQGIPQDEELLKEIFNSGDARVIGNEEFLVKNIVDLMVKREKTKESVLFFVETMKKYPHHLALNSLYRLHLSRVVSELQDLGTIDVSSFQFRSLYECLYELGILSTKCHILAIEHYEQTGAKEKAHEIRKALSITAPHYHGL